ncbi:hypothetical protein M433DRAFT_154915 [Acidomyces richmondensis BFW]|nr:MAG: hypothetical protein FE78DRAFT_91308 [Acidomyces sp. 'richmondensis']KYG45089.1 hypothetical protein M433DRAFT_154915 [Acidomyces richmondensis BFW]
MPLWQPCVTVLDAVAVAVAVVAGRTGCSRDLLELEQVVFIPLSAKVMEAQEESKEKTDITSSPDICFAFIKLARLRQQEYIQQRKARHCNIGGKRELLPRQSSPQCRWDPIITFHLPLTRNRLSAIARPVHCRNMSGRCCQLDNGCCPCDSCALYGVV